MNFTGNIDSVLGCAIEKKTNIRYGSNKYLFAFYLYKGVFRTEFEL